jgi:hypothetical protein
MAIKIKLRVSPFTEYNVNDAYAGGFLVIVPTEYGDCPMIQYDDAVDKIADIINVQPPKAVSDIFEIVDTDAPYVDPLINPDLNAIPIVNSPLSKAYTNFNAADYDTTFKLTLNNPNLYKVQFATNRMGTLTVDGYYLPDGTGFVDVTPDEFGVYSIETASSTVDNQTIWCKYKRTSGYDNTKISFSTFKPMDTYLVSGGGGGGQTTGNAQSPLNGVPLLAHVWGMMGNDNPDVFKQGTYEDDVAALQEKGVENADVLKAFPWHAKQTLPTPYLVSRWVNGVDQGLPKRAVNLTWSFLLDDLVMTQYIDYAVRCGIQGFMLLNYANDGYLSLFRRVFRKTIINKRGIKICYSLNFGGEGRENYAADEANNNPVFSPYRQTVYDMASDLTQGLANGWYATARKMISGTPTQVPIFHVLYEGGGATETQVSDLAWEDLARIKAKAGYSGETFNIKMTSGPDLTIGLGAADDIGNVWNATTIYYNQPELSTGFTGSTAILNAQMANTPCANKVPMVSWGYNSDPRRKFHGLEGNGGFPYEDVINHMPSLLNTLKGHMNNNAKDIRVALCGQVGEWAEQGQDLFRNYYGDERMFNIFKDKFVDNR